MGEICQTVAGFVRQQMKTSIGLKKESLLSVCHGWRNQMIHLMREIQHPVTGCNEVYCLTDTLHERNCKIPAEKLKSTRLVLELAGKLNTQVLEQINAEIGRSMYFLNEMSAHKQVFVLWLLMHLHNEKVNGTLLRTLTQKLGPLGKDSLGRLTCRYQ